jgi:hypothetical protein
MDQRHVGVRAGLIERGDVLLGESGRLSVAGVALGRPDLLPVGRYLEALRIDRHQILRDVGGTTFHEQLLDHHLGDLVLALAEVVEANLALRVCDVDRRPEVVGERSPHPVVAVHGDWPVDSKPTE